MNVLSNVKPVSPRDILAKASAALVTIDHSPLHPGDRNRLQIARQMVDLLLEAQPLPGHPPRIPAVPSDPREIAWALSDIVNRAGLRVGDLKAIEGAHALIFNLIQEGKL